MKFSVINVHLVMRRLYFPARFVVVVISVNDVIYVVCIFPVAIYAVTHNQLIMYLIIIGGVICKTL